MEWCMGVIGVSMVALIWWHNEYGGNPDKQALIVHLLVFGGFGVCMLLDLAIG